jgi:O-methyltransferase
VSNLISIKEQFIEDILESSIKNNSTLIICGITSLGLLINKRFKELGLSERILGYCEPFNHIRTSAVRHHKIYSIAELNSIEFDEIAITYDKEKDEVLTALNKSLNKISKVHVFGDTNYDFQDPIFTRILSSLHVKSKAGGYSNILTHIYQAICYLESAGIEGDIIEFGTFRGGTTVFMAKVLNELKSSKKIYSFDTFKGFPGKTSSLDIFDDEKYNYADYTEVKKYCSNYNIELISGNIMETINVIDKKKVSLAFFDTDNYSASKIALEKIYPNTSIGGIFAFDHYYSKEWIKTIGERIAAKEILLEKNMFHLHGTGVFMKVKF